MQGSNLLTRHTYLLGPNLVQPLLLSLMTPAAGLQVFGDPRHPPDAEFGCCALVYGPDGSEYDGEALLRVDIGAARGGRARSLPLLFVLPADQAIK